MDNGRPGLDPTLVANPSDDETFVAFARLLVDRGASSVLELQRRLQSVYPLARVHLRELAGEPVLIWYVYRDGHWVRSRTLDGRRQEHERAVPDPREDLRSTEDSMSRDAERVEALEDQQARLDPEDPRIDALADEVERLSAELRDKAAAERELSEQVGRSSSSGEAG